MSLPYASYAPFSSGKLGVISMLFRRVPISGHYHVASAWDKYRHNGCGYWRIIAKAGNRRITAT
jgi:hypothetical protein